MSSFCLATEAQQYKVLTCEDKLLNEKNERINKTKDKVLKDDAYYSIAKGVFFIPFEKGK